MGTFNISKPGYIKVDIQGTTKNNNTFGEISHITATGDAVSGKIYSAMILLITIGREEVLPAI